MIYRSPGLKCRIILLLIKNFFCQIKYKIQRPLCKSISEFFHAGGKLGTLCFFCFCFVLFSVFRFLRIRFRIICLYIIAR